MKKRVSFRGGSLTVVLATICCILIVHIGYTNLFPVISEAETTAQPTTAQPHTTAPTVTAPPPTTTAMVCPTSTTAPVSEHNNLISLITGVGAGKLRDALSSQLAEGGIAAFCGSDWGCHIDTMLRMTHVLNEAASPADLSSRWFRMMGFALRGAIRVLVEAMRSADVATGPLCKQAATTIANMAASPILCTDEGLVSELKAICKPHNFVGVFNAAFEKARAAAPPTPSNWNPCGVTTMMIKSNDVAPVSDELRRRMEATIGPYAQFMVQRSAKMVKLFGEEFTAFTETEKAIAGDDWFWTDDNAKTLEMLVLPGVYEKVAPVANKVLKFVLRMIRGDFMLRRAAMPTTDANREGFKVEEDGCMKVRLHNGLMNYNGDPTHLRQSYRFHDGRDQDVVAHTAPHVHVVFEDATELAFDLGNTSLHNTCFFRDVPGQKLIECGFSGNLSAGGKVFARFEFSHVLSSTKTVTEHRVSVTPVEGAPTFRVRVALGEDMLPTTRMRDLTAYTKSGIKKAVVDLNDNTNVHGAFGDEVPIWHACVMPESVGFSYGSFRFITTPKWFRKVTVVRRKEQRSEIERVVNHYECDGGSECTVREARLITAGGLYDDMNRYVGMLERLSRGEDDGIIDYSISYDIGAELNGLASFYHFTTSGAYGSFDGHREVNLSEVKEAIDRHLSIYWKVFARQNATDHIPNLFIRGFAFAAISVNTMFAATGEVAYLHQLERAMKLMFTPRATGLVNEKGEARAESMFTCMGSEQWSAVDCQASAHLLFGRILTTFPFGVSSSPYLQLCRVASAAVHAGAPLYRNTSQQWGPQFNLEHGGQEAGFTWGFTGGILARAINAVRLGSGRYRECQGVSDWVSPEKQLTFAELERAIYNYSDASTTIHDGGALKEIRTSVFSAETNTESQPWIAMGLHGALVEELYQASLVNSVMRQVPFKRRLHQRAV